MLAFEPPCDCPICMIMRSLWADTIAAEHYHLDDAEQPVRTYAPPRMTQ